jgi:hypothetical protein
VNTTGVLAEVEGAVGAHLALAAGDPAVEAAGAALLAAIGPALRQAAVQLAEQAALEVTAQLPEAGVEVLLRDGEPCLVVRSDDDRSTRYRNDELAARLTVRLPDGLKQEIEGAAAAGGDSVNTYVIKALSSQSRRKRSRRRIQGTFET